MESEHRALIFHWFHEGTTRMDEFQAPLAAQLGSIRLQMLDFLHLHQADQTSTFYKDGLPKNLPLSHDWPMVAGGRWVLIVVYDG